MDTWTGTTWKIPESTTSTYSIISLCLNCKHLLAVDLEGYIECRKGVKGILKAYCTLFERK